MRPELIELTSQLCVDIQHIIHNIDTHLLPTISYVKKDAAT